ncbi:PREDICTED: RNA-binding protein 44-like [Propithecus coquereli]|uniref:RNA-binding protein 44-like n=1 Tax=Propithecus coquereli TaxID=379532 RepID=UPI00063F63A3|nr:PREDICTED: RNA-binding protein 44-like [Propithecus coquereli]
MIKQVVANQNLSSNSAKKELGSALLSLLGDLKVRYVNLKEKIHKGIPLEELPPLSVESKLLSTFSTFASRLMKEESHVFSGADSELDNQSAQDVDVSSNLKKTLSQVNCRNYQEISEDWFDAKENLTGVDFSGIQENQIEQDKWNPKYASLAFKKNSDAKMAVKEMNGLEINGKSVNVRLVKIPGEYPSPLASKYENKTSLNNLEKSTNKEINSAIPVPKLPRTRPRQLGSEQDSEFFSFDRKVSFLD